MKLKTINSIMLLTLFLIGGNSSSFATVKTTIDTAPMSTCQFQRAMDKLWEDHVFWTRAYLVSATTKSEDKALVLQRLLKNQADIGEAIKPFYGQDASTKLTSLLTEHIGIAGEIIDNLMNDKATEAQLAIVRWQRNADDLASFLSSANPMNWPMVDLKTMLDEHLQTTTVEVQAQIAKDWAGSIAAFDKANDTILKMSEVLATGIIKQFPEKFEPCDL